MCHFNEESKVKVTLETKVLVVFLTKEMLVVLGVLANE